MFGKSRMKRINPEQVAHNFAQAIALGLAEEALSYCSDKVRIAFPGDNFEYSTKDNLININTIIEHFATTPLNNVSNDLKIQVAASCDNEVTILTYYDHVNAECFTQPNHLMRLVLEKSHHNWSIQFINYMFNIPPTQITWEPELNIKPVFPVCSLYTCYNFQTEEYLNYHIELWYQDLVRISKVHLDKCNSLQIQEMFPGVEIAFFREDSFRRCYFLFTATEVSIFKLDKANMGIRVRFPEFVIESQPV